ncbi:aldose 1-epimerase family protein [Kutzneria viridogrisea]|uniref:Aldose 1-epimerase n=2 Tax=Kutzneria TaxID=43356 RepID=W5VZI6_9PSEU|nr:aldose 1-epimerase family protein [Kutzneria albida]AHH93992.1 Aldose 1-epimerase [Kutzneria albida DSM 43870]MBA8931003.1 aldose 1-epimerase [Kutzneria viridogrisea]
MSGPTGAQFEITYGTARAVVTGIGAGLRVFEVAGQPYVETFAESEAPPMGSGNVLAPWPNRVAGGRWRFDGAEQQLELTEPARGNASHGLVRKVPWQVITHTGSLISLGVEVGVQPGWPVPLRVTISYALDAHGLTVTHGVHNIGDRAVPFGIGTHPYVRAGASATDDCTLRLAATTSLPLDPESMVPCGPQVGLSRTEVDFRRPRSLRGERLDHAFGGCVPGADGLVRHRLTGPKTAVELWADPDFRWVQVYTPDEFPGRGRAVAIEPMTCPPDALNSGIDLITLAPGDAWSGRWGLIPR